MPIKNYSTTAANNNAAPPNGFPEGMAPSDVNNSARTVMADIRSWYEDAQWIDYGNVPTYVSTNSFSVIGNQTAIYTVGRRIKLSDASNLYGTISASVFTTLTTVTVTLDSGSLTIALNAVALGIITPSSNALPAGSFPTAFSDSAFRIQDNADATRQLAFEVGGITTGTTRTITLPDANTTLPVISQPLTITGLTAARSFSLPDANGAIVTDAATQTLTNKTLNQPNIVGVTDGSNAAAGSVGEFVSSTVLTGAAVSLTTGTTANVASISLTAGDWDIRGVVALNKGSTTSVTTEAAAITTVSATYPALGLTNSALIRNQATTYNGTAAGAVLPVGVTRLNITSTTTVYLVANCTFTVSTMSAYGAIEARRVR
jgi:hypothetical protein